jgi:hypothetical protein
LEELSDEDFGQFGCGGVWSSGTFDVSFGHL